MATAGGEAPAAADATSKLNETALWNAEDNERLLTHGAEEVLVPEGYEPSGDFIKDYLFFVELMGIRPHPELHRSKLPRARVFNADGEFVVDDDADAEEPPQRDSQNVVIRNHTLDRATLKAVCKALPTATSLVQLRLYNAGLSARGVLELANALVGSSVVTVHIEYNPLSDDEAILADTPDDEAQAESENGDGAVSAAGEGEPAEGADATGAAEEKDIIAAAISKDPSAVFAKLLELPLQVLSLRGNAISAEGATVIAKKLYDHKTLSSLNLFDNSIGAEGAQALIDMLYCNRSITHLILGRNSIPAGVAAKALLPLCNPVVPPHVGEERKALGLAVSDSRKAGKTKKKKKRAGQGIDTELPAMYQNEEGEFISEINGNVQAIDLSFNHFGGPGLATVVAPLAAIQGGAVGGDPVGLAFLGLARVGAADADKDSAAETAMTALPQLRLAL